MEQELLHGVVGNKEINSSVAIIVGNGDAQGFGRFIEPQLMRYFGEMPVTIVMVNEHGNGFEYVWMTVIPIAFFVLAAPHIVPVPLDIPQNDQVKQAIVVQVDPGGGSGPTAACDTCLLGNIGESA